jgi:two-component system response regulator
LSTRENRVTKTILLVEDSESDELLTVHALKRASVANEVVVARDGEEALDFLFGRGAHGGRDTSALPSLVLLDLNLPKVVGLDVLREIRGAEQTRLIPVVVLTSSREDEDMVASYRLGANACIRKPVDLAQFAEATKTLGLFWLLLNETPPRGALVR